MSSLLGTTADWYLMRASGFIAFVLLTVTVALGVANLARLAKGRWTRTVAAILHRNVSLLAVVFLVIHVLTAISDRYVKVSALAIIIPGASGYDPLWVGLGAVAVDLLVAIVVTSLLRARIRPLVWRVIHWTAYLTWPTALIHSIGSGSGSGRDTGTLWSAVIYLACGLLFAAAVAVRLNRSRRPEVPAPVPTTARRPRYLPPTSHLDPTTPTRQPVGTSRRSS